MAIAKRPSGNKGATNIPNEKAVENFIAGAGQGKTGTPALEEKSAKKIGVMVYFDRDVLSRVDATAKKHGLSRSSWLHSKAIEALDQDGPDRR